MFLSLCVYAIDIKGFREYLGNRILKISELLHMQCNRGRTSYFNFKHIFINVIHFKCQDNHA